MLWDWVWELKKEMRPRPFVAIWSRGGAKSSSAELAATMSAMRLTRRYIVYVCETQDQADKHVATIATLLESANVQRALNKYGSSKGWRRNRLRTNQGATIDALGLDTASRGIKVDADRPDMIVLDDVDGRHDTQNATLKKQDTLTQTILPAGSNDCAVLFVQNLIHGNSIASRLVDGRADYLSDRIISGAYKAIEGLQYKTVNGETTITSGVATWAGQSIEVAQGQIKTWGLRAFLREAQHEVADALGALWKREEIEITRVAGFPELYRIGTGVDPSGNEGESDACGIVTAGVGYCNCKGFSELHAFVLDDATVAANPNTWAKAAIGSYNKAHGDVLVAEGNYGGKMVTTVLQTVPGAPPVKIVNASHGKQARAEPIHSLYTEHKIHHVGYYAELENEMCQWEPASGAQSPNRLDALVWILTELMIGGGISVAFEA